MTDPTPLSSPSRHRTARALPFCLGLGLAASFGATPALALPIVGDPVASAKLEDADGRAIDLGSFRGKPILIVYEDRDSAKQNDALKKDLARLAAGDKYKTSVALAAVANVSAFDFWPIKGIVKDAIRKESKKQGTTIFCDWSGAFRKALRMRDRASSVVLVGRDGNVLFAADGSISIEARQRLIDLLRKEVEGVS